MRKWRGGTALLLTAAVILSTAAKPFFGTSVFAAETLDAIIVVDEDAENTEDNAGGGAETLTTSTVSGNEIKEIPVKDPDEETKTSGEEEAEGALEPALPEDPLETKELPAEEPEEEVAPEPRLIEELLPLPEERTNLYIESGTRPSLFTLVSLMPQTLTARLSDGTSAEVPVSWYSVEDYEGSESYYFQFSPVIDEGLYALREGYDLIAQAPYIGVFLDAGEDSGPATDSVDSFIAPRLFASSINPLGSASKLSATRFVAGKNENEKEIFAYLTGSMGLNRAAAAGILANIYCESTFRPSVYGDQGTSYGICQWHATRFQNLKDYCSGHGYDYTTLSGQLHFLDYELNSGGYKYILNYLKSDKIPETAEGAYEAGRYWCYEFERPANRESVSVTRGALSRDTFWSAWKDAAVEVKEEPKEEPTLEPTPPASPAPTAVPTPEPIEIPKEVWEDKADTEAVSAQETLEVVNEIEAEDVEASLPDELWIAGARSSFTYDGTAKKQTLRVYFGQTRLIEGIDYTLLYKNNTKVYEIADLSRLTQTDLVKAPRVVVKFKGNYSGSRTIYYSIHPLASPQSTEEAEGEGALLRTKVTLSKVKAASVPEQTYMGSAFTVSDLVYKDLTPYKLSLTYNGYTLKEREDYNVLSVTNAVEAGTATIVLQGTENSSVPGESGGAYSFSGLKQIKFKIVKYPVSGSSFIVDGESEGITASYVKGGARPKPIVRFQGRVLKEGRDYSLSYSNNNKLGGPADKKAPTITISGKGSFSGKRKIPFTVTGAAFTRAAGVSVLVSDKNESTKKNNFKSSVKVVDSGGKTLKAGTDYEKGILYYLQVEQADGNKMRLLTAKDCPPAGSVIIACVTGKGAYSADTIYATYRILKSTQNISKATIKLAPQAYTGSPVKITDSSQFVRTSDGMGRITAYVKINKQTVFLDFNKDFEVVPGSYVSNIKKGTAKVTFRGIGDYGGFRTVSFKITARAAR